MKKTHLALAGLGMALLLIGAGCSQDSSTSDDSAMQTKNAADVPAETQPSMAPSSTGDQVAPNPTDEQKPADTGAMNTPDGKGPSAVSGDLVLSGQSMTQGAVKLSWVAPTGLTNSNRFIVISGKDDNPSLDGKHAWFRQFYTSREMTWEDLPAGPTHFRICLTENNQNDTCTAYSNDVVVDVQ